MNRVTATDTLVYLEDTSFYQIVTSADTLKSTDEYVDVDIRILSGENVTILDLEQAKEQGFTLKANIDGTNISNLIEYTSDSQIYGFNVQGHKRLNIFLYLNDVQVAEKSLTVVSDGARGDVALICYSAGEFDASTTYATTTTTTPMVYYNGSYYVLNSDKTFKGDGSCGYTNPQDEYAANGGSGYWQFMEYYKAIFVELAMVNYGKIAKAVFSGDFMFSQQGTYNKLGSYFRCEGKLTQVSPAKVDSWSTPVKIHNTTQREVRYAAGGNTAPPIVKTDRKPDGWSRVPVKKDYNTFMWMTTASLNSDDTLASNWSTPAMIGSNIPLTVGQKVYIFYGNPLIATAPSDTSFPPSNWSTSPTLTTTENSSDYENFDGEYDIFEPNIAIDFLSGLIRMNNAVIRGTITTPKTTITGSNYQKLCFDMAQDVDFITTKLWCPYWDKMSDFIILDASLDTSLYMYMPYISSKYSDSELEAMRSWIGKTIKVYNYSSQDTFITGSTRQVGSESTVSFYLKAGYCVSLTCYLRSNYGSTSEQLSWEWYQPSKILDY